MRFVPRRLVLYAGKRIVCGFSACALLALAVGDGISQDLKPRIRLDVESGDWAADASWKLEPSDPPERGVPAEGEVASIRNGGTATVSGAVGKVDAVAINNGLVDVVGGGVLEAAGNVALGGNGMLSVGGNGSVTAANLGNGGTLSVAGKDAVVSVSGNFDNDGTISLSTTGADPYSIIQVAGRADLNGGAIDLASTPDGASFDFGNSWAFLKSGSVSGRPSAITVGGEAPSLPRGLSLQVATDAEGTSAVTVGNVPVATVNRATGDVTVSNVVGAAMDVKGYMLTSASGLLNPETWNSKTDQGLAGWIEANPLPTQLNETNLSSSTTLGVGDSLSLGAAYAGGRTPPRAEDVALAVLLADGRVVDGIVEYTGPANDLVLNVDPATGAATLQNLSVSAGDFDVTGYTISSASGALNVDAFQGIGEDNWVKANPSTGALSEITLTANKVFSNNTVVNLGNIFTPGGAQDLVLEYGTTDFELSLGTVEYGGAVDPPSGFDCNGDGVVNIQDTLCATAETIAGTLDAAGLIAGDLDGSGDVGFPDFLALSDAFGGPGNYQQGDIDLSGDVGFPDFLVLSENFGQTAAASAVPEPTSGLLAFFGLLGLLQFRRRARRVMATAVAVAVISSAASAQEFDTRFVRLSPETPNVINNWHEAQGILNGTVVDVVINEDLTGSLDIIDLAGGGGHFEFVNNPYLNEVNDDSMVDFIQYVSGTLFLPEGEWTIGLGSDDGGFVNMPNVTLSETFNERGPGITDGDGEIIFNAGRGHGWTAGIFTVPAGGVTTPFEGGFYERTGGDSLEIAIANEHWDPDGEFENLREFFTNVGFELEHEIIDGVRVTGDAFVPPAVGDFNGDGTVDTADYEVLTANLGTGSSVGQGDINGDSAVNLLDVGEFIAIFPAPAGASAVPEPASMSLLLFAAAMLLGAKRRSSRR